MKNPVEATVSMDVKVGRAHNADSEPMSNGKFHVGGMNSARALNILVLLHGETYRDVPGGMPDILNSAGCYGSGSNLEAPNDHEGNAVLGDHLYVEGHNIVVSGEVLYVGGRNV